MTVRILSLAALCVLFLGAAAFGQDMAEMYAQGYRLDTELKSRSAPIMPSLRWQRNVTFAEALPVKEGKSTTSLALDLLHPADAVAKPRPLVLLSTAGAGPPETDRWVKASCPCSPVAGLWRGRCRTVFLEMLPTPQRCKMWPPRWLGFEPTRRHSGWIPTELPYGVIQPGPIWPSTLLFLIPSERKASAVRLGWPDRTTFCWKRTSPCLGR